MVEERGKGYEGGDDMENQKKEDVSDSMTNAKMRSQRVMVIYEEEEEEEDGGGEG